MSTTRAVPRSSQVRAGELCASGPATRTETKGNLAGPHGSPALPPALPMYDASMQFTKRLREGIRRGRIRCTVRIWARPHVKAGGRYRMDEGHVVVDGIEPIAVTDITHDLARESGFDSVDDLLQVARHGQGDNVYLIRFHYVAPGAWDTPGRAAAHHVSGGRRP